MDDYPCTHSLLTYCRAYAILKAKLGNLMLIITKNVSQDTANWLMQLYSPLYFWSKGSILKPDLRWKVICEVTAIQIPLSLCLMPYVIHLKSNSYLLYYVSISVIKARESMTGCFHAASNFKMALAQAHLQCQFPAQLELRTVILTTKAVFRRLVKRDFQEKAITSLKLAFWGRSPARFPCPGIE